MDWYSKSYKSIGGFKCKYWYHFSVQLRLKKYDYMDKLYGYSPVQYDGWFHIFNIYPIRIHWHKRPILAEDIYD